MFSSLGYHDSHGGLPLPNCILRKLLLYCITIVAHDVELGGAKVVLGLDVLEEVKVGIVFICHIMTNLLVHQAFFSEGNNTNLTPSIVQCNSRIRSDSTVKNQPECGSS